MRDAARVYQVRVHVRTRTPEQVMVCFPHMNFQFQLLYFNVAFFVPLLHKSLETIPRTMDLVEHLIAFGGIEIWF